MVCRERVGRAAMSQIGGQEWRFCASSLINWSFGAGLAQRFSPPRARSAPSDSRLKSGRSSNRAYRVGLKLLHERKSSGNGATTRVDGSARRHASCVGGDLPRPCSRSSSTNWASATDPDQRNQRLPSPYRKAIFLFSFRNGRAQSQKLRTLISPLSSSFELFNRRFNARPQSRHKRSGMLTSTTGPRDSALSPSAKPYSPAEIFQPSSVQSARIRGSMETVTFSDLPGFNVTRRNPARRCFT